MPSPLIPRRVFFCNPDREQVAISPDGQWLSWLAPVDGVLNGWVAPVSDPGAAKAMTHDRGRGIRSFFWAKNSRDMLYMQDKDGDENWHVFAVDVSSGVTRDLTPGEGFQARVSMLSAARPDEVVIALNDSEPEWHDLHIVNVKTGAKELLLENREFAGFLFDWQLNPVVGVRFDPTGEIIWSRRDCGAWTPWQRIPREDTDNTDFICMDGSNRRFYFRESRGRNTSALALGDIDHGSVRILAEDDDCDLDEVFLHPTTLEPVAASFTRDRTRWEVLDESARGDFEALAQVCRGELGIESASHDLARWVVSYCVDDGPRRYYLWDRAAQEARFLFVNREPLSAHKFQPMEAHTIEARDGLPLVSYLTLPSHATGPVPLVVCVHGGPWHRDRWGFHREHQWLANRGYAVLSVNFRGSTGFGKTHLNAGDLEWGRNMHEDLLDAVDWAVTRGVADHERVAIFGGSYGGYATLAALTFTPEKFRCGVDIVGPSNLVTLLESIPPYWAPVIQSFKDRVGDPDTEAGRKLLEERSPLNAVDAICRPLLIAQGANDPRVKKAESDQIVAAMRAKGLPVTYLLYPDEGHGFARPENNLSFYAVAEAFLAQHLGGACEPVGADFEGSSIKILEGRDQVQSLGVGGA